MILIKVDRFDDRSVSDGKSDPPARHIIRFGQGIDFDSRLFCAFGLQKAQRFMPVKTDGSVREIMNDTNAVLLRKTDRLLENASVATAPVGLFG